jgi:hypothetical protein
MLQNKALDAFMTSALMAVSCRIDVLAASSLGKESSVCIEWEASLDVVKKRKISCPYRQSNLDSSVVQTAARSLCYLVIPAVESK